MPLLDHFHPPLSMTRPWGGFFSAWAATISSQLNDAQLPGGYFAMPVVEMAKSFAVQVRRDSDDPQLRAVVELVSPIHKADSASRRAFAARCAQHLLRGVPTMIIDIVTERQANLHADLLGALNEVENHARWQAPSGLYAVTYRSVRAAAQSRLEIWTKVLIIGDPLPELPLWLGQDLPIPLRLEESYTITCRSLRLPG